MLNNTKNFIEDLIADEVMGVNIEVAKKCLKEVSKAQKIKSYPEKKIVILACNWFNDNRISASINNNGFLELEFKNDNGDTEHYVSVSVGEIEHRASLQSEILENEAFCSNCGKEVIVDEAENCPDCGIWLGDEIKNHTVKNSSYFGIYSLGKLSSTFVLESVSENGSNVLNIIDIFGDGIDKEDIDTLTDLSFNLTCKENSIDFISHNDSSLTLVALSGNEYKDITEI